MNARKIPISTTFQEVTIRNGMVFWVLWAALEATQREPDVHSMNLFNAFETFYPLASEYDRRLIVENLLPTVARMADEAEAADQEANCYFLKRVEYRLRGGRGE